MEVLALGVSTVIGILFGNGCCAVYAQTAFLVYNSSGSRDVDYCSSCYAALRERFTLDSFCGMEYLNPYSFSKNEFQLLNIVYLVEKKSIC
jgi:hypothetical protein